MLKTPSLLLLKSEPSPMPKHTSCIEQGRPQSNCHIPQPRYRLCIIAIVRLLTNQKLRTRHICNSTSFSNYSILLFLFILFLWPYLLNRPYLHSALVLALSGQGLLLAQSRTLQHPPALSSRHAPLCCPYLCLSYRS